MAISIEILCRVDREKCDELRSSIERAVLLLGEEGFQLKRVLVIIKRCGDTATVYVDGKALAGVDAVGAFHVDAEPPSAYVEMLHWILSSHLYSSEALLRTCPRWVVEGISLYTALRVYSKVDPSGARLVEGFYLGSAAGLEQVLGDMREWSYRDHPGIQLISRMIGEKVARMMRAYISVESERRGCTDSALRVRASAYMAIKRALEASGLGVIGLIDLLSKAGSCEEKVLEVIRGGGTW